jgi:YD repeat-containing protein
MRARLRDGVLAAIASLLSAQLLAQGAPIRYIHDELGRLVSVVDQNGDAATYHYDAVGNLTGITRTSTGTVAIFEFTPNAAPIGSSVTLYGIGFSGTPAQNTVTINGTPASVTAATATTLAITVPAGATSGLLSVTTPAGSATASPAFVVAAGMGAPSISGISPTIGLAGTAVTVSGANFDTTLANDKVRFNVSYGSPTSVTSSQIVSAVPFSGTSGPITMSTPFGTAVSAQDFFVPPAPFTVSDVAVTDRMTFGTDKVVTVSTEGKIGLVVFDATAGQRLALSASGGSAVFYVYMNDPYGRVAGSAAVGYNEVLIGPTRAPVNSTYTVLVDPAWTYTGSATLRLYDVPPDVSGTIVAGGAPVPFAATVPGQNGRWTFTGTSGQRVSATVAGSTISSMYLSALNPDGTILEGPAGFIDGVTLPATGTYSLFADPLGVATGSATITLHEVPADATATLTPGGSATLTIVKPGQNGRYTFSGTSGQRVSITVDPGPLSNLTVRKPDNSTLTTGSVGVLTSFFEPMVLPSTGTYSIDVDPLGTGTGNVTLTLHDVPPDASGSITPGGAPVTVTTTTPGQNGALTFSGVTGQRVSVSLSSGPGGTVSVRRANGTSLSSTNLTVLAGFIEPVTLPASETYSVVVDYTGYNTGSVTLYLFDVAADLTGSVTIGGSSLPVGITTPGQNGSVTFSGSASQQVTVHLTSNTVGLTTVKLLKPDGTQLTSWSASAAGFDLSTVTLPTTGTYTVVVDPHTAGTGSISVNVTNP